MLPEPTTQPKETIMECDKCGRNDVDVEPGCKFPGNYCLKCYEKLVRKVNFY